MSDFWSELEDDVLACLARDSAAPADLARRLALSEGAVVSRTLAA